MVLLTYPNHLDSSKSNDDPMTILISHLQNNIVKTTELICELTNDSFKFDDRNKFSGSSIATFLQNLTLLEISANDDSFWLFNEQFLLDNFSQNLTSLKLDLSLSKMKANELGTKISLNKSLESLSLSFNKATEEPFDNLKELLDPISNKNLKIKEFHLEINPEKLTESDWVSLSNFLEQFQKSLTKLSLIFQNCRSYPLEITLPFNSIKKLSVLTELTIELSDEIDEISLKVIKQIRSSIEEAIKFRIEKLITLKINQSCLLQKKADLSQFLHLIGSFRSSILETLSLDISSDQKFDNTFLLSLSQNFNRLQTLHLYLNNMKGFKEGLSFNPEHIQTIKWLKLDLINTDISKCSKSAFDFLETMQSLERFEINLCQSENIKKIVFDLANNVSRIKNLTSLNFQIFEYDMPEKQNTKILKSFCMCKFLRSLHVCHALGEVWSSHQFYRKLKYLVELNMEY